MDPSVSSLVSVPGVELEGELGRGAYSIVYRGRQGGEPCAVKIPRSRGKWTRWAYREAVAIARVRSPGLPAVREVGEVDGLPFMVMELVAGETLGDRLLRGPLPEREALDLGASIAWTLADVHDADLVHRDVKPRNIISEASGRVRLVDFGFATPTAPGSVFDRAGTAAYAAPEQLFASARVDVRADLYALGRVLYECVVGHLPSTRSPADRPTPEGLAGSLRAAGATDEFVRLLLGLVAEDPEQRYPDARAASADFERVRLARAPLGPSAYVGASRRRAPVVVRAAELTLLVDVWRAVASGQGACVAVEGARGSGKSRLLAAATARGASLSARTVSITCATGTPPLGAVRAILEAYVVEVGRLGASERAALVGCMQGAFADEIGTVAVAIAPTFEQVIGSRPVTRRPDPAGLAESGAEILVRLARNGSPLVVVVDDFHAADPASRDVLVRAAFRAREVPLALVFAARPQPTGGALELLSDVGGLLRVPLSALPLEHIAQVVAHHLGAKELPEGVVERVAMLGEDTPLGVLEALGALLDVGAVRPGSGKWILDIDKAERVALPAGALMLLGRRVAELPPATRVVLDAAAVLGTNFDERVVAATSGVPEADLAYALADAVRSGLVVGRERGRRRFVHDSVRELLLAALPIGVRRAWHQKAAAVILGLGPDDEDTVCRAADHYAEGELEQDPARAYVVALRASDAALARFDNETALRYLELARAAAKHARLPVDGEIDRRAGEANLRRGAFDASLACFNRALEVARAGMPRARLLGRIAWVHQTRSDPEPAWAALSRAFDALGEKMPVEDAGSAFATLRNVASVALRELGRDVAPRSTASMEHIELSCELHHQNARLGLEYGKPFRLAQSTLRALEASEALGPSRPLARAKATYGFVLTALGRKAAGAAELARAHAIATQIGDPVTLALADRLCALGAIWAGDFDAALDLLRTCIDDNGPWYELPEFCLEVANADFIEFSRGRSSRAWAWLERAIERIRRSGGETNIFTEYVMRRALASLAALGRPVASLDPWLRKQLERVAKLPPAPGFLGLMTWASRLRAFSDRGDLGEGFEAIVRGFEAERVSPKGAHPVLLEYYASLAHARMHQCFRAPEGRRAAAIRALEKAASDLRVAAKLAVFRAHALLVDGCLAWLKRDDARARRLLGEAESLASKEKAPVVLYGVARVRAHALAQEGNPEGAREYARFAEMLAREHGSASRAAWVREEFSLPDVASTSVLGAAASRRSSSHRRHLAALLDVIGSPLTRRTTGEQTLAVVTEVLDDLFAERVVVWLPHSGEPTTVGKTRAGETFHEVTGARAELLQSTLDRGVAWPPDDDVVDLGSGVDSTRLLCVPLFLRDVGVGVVVVERAAGDPSFSQEDRELLDVLADQIPVAIEAVRLVLQRQQRSLRPTALEKQ